MNIWCVELLAAGGLFIFIHKACRLVDLYFLIYTSMNPNMWRGEKDQMRIGGSVAVCNCSNLTDLYFCDHLLIVLEVYYWTVDTCSHLAVQNQYRIVVRIQQCLLGSDKLKY